MEVVEINKQEQRALKRALRLYGSITRMQEGAELSRTAIVNLRDKRRADKITVEKVSKYLGWPTVSCFPAKEETAA